MLEGGTIDIIAYRQISTYTVLWGDRYHSVRMKSHQYSSFARLQLPYLRGSFPTWRIKFFVTNQTRKFLEGISLSDYWTSLLMFLSGLSNASRFSWNIPISRNSLTRHKAKVLERWCASVNQVRHSSRQGFALVSWSSCGKLSAVFWIQHSKNISSSFVQPFFEPSVQCYQVDQENSAMRLPRKYQ